MVLSLNYLYKCRSHLKLLNRSNLTKCVAAFYSKSNNKSIDQIKEEILKKSIEFVPESGWSKESIVQATKSLGYPSHLHGIVDRGSIDLINYFYETSNEAMSQKLDDWIKSKTKDDKITTGTILREGVEIRLKLLEPVILKWPQALIQLSLPSNILHTSWLFRNLLGDLWVKAGDRSTDMSWYGKRAVLGAVYTATELFMIQDTSQGFTETWHFLDRRFIEAESVGHCGRNTGYIIKTSRENVLAMKQLIKNVAGIERNN